MKSSRGQSTTTTTPMSSPPPSSCQGDEDRNFRIALAAYYKAEARGFDPGHEIEDWLAAEAEEK